MSGQSDIDRLLAEALDDFDEPPSKPAAAASQPVASLQPATQTMATETMNSAPSVLPADNPVPPPPAPLTAEPTTNDMSAEAQADELAKVLMESLNMGGVTDANSNFDDLDDDQMEQTLRNLAKSAEALADEDGGAGSSEEEAMMRLLKQLGEGLGSDPSSASDAGMLDILQKFGGLAPDGGGGGGVGGGAAAASCGAGAATSAPYMPASASMGGAGGSANEDQVEGMLDSLVGQLLSKDVMLEPMRHLHAEFPRYIATHKDTLKADELERCGLISHATVGPPLPDAPAVKDLPFL